jgi:serine/threonine protein phosphatase PrpC
MIRSRILVSLRRTLVVYIFGLLWSRVSALGRPAYIVATDRRPSCIFPSTSLRHFAAPINLADVGVFNIPGSDPERPRKVNQDRHFLFQNDETIVVGVMDGHGKDGHKLTEFLATQLPFRLKESLNSSTLNKSDHAALREMEERLVTLGKAKSTSMSEEHVVVSGTLIQAFHLAHHDACQNTAVPAGRSGTTCVACVVTDDSIVTASVGDSTLILGLYAAPDVAAEGYVLSTEVLSVRTTVQIEGERSRIQAGEGRVDGNGNVFYGPVGIAMTRALGDAVMLRAGILPTPMIRNFNRPVSHAQEETGEILSMIVLGSDGVFDVMTKEDVIQLAGQVIQEFESTKTAAEAICNEARRRWLANLPIEPKVDDITCAVVQI